MPFIDNQGALVYGFPVKNVWTSPVDPSWSNSVDSAVAESMLVTGNVNCNREPLGTSTLKFIWSLRRVATPARLGQI